jgi:hypothetical protein
MTINRSPVSASRSLAGWTTKLCTSLFAHGGSLSAREPLQRSAGQARRLGDHERTVTKGAGGEERFASCRRISQRIGQSEGELPGPRPAGQPRLRSSCLIVLTGLLLSNGLMMVAPGRLLAAPQEKPNTPAAPASTATPTVGQQAGPPAAQTPPAASAATEGQPEKSPPERGLPAPEGLVRLIPDKPIWLDVKQKQVIVDGEVCLREGQLEMFACPRQTKEHESILSVGVPAQFIHAALVAVGAKKGAPVQFDPEYKPATGTIIDITLVWQDAQGKRQQTRAQDWVRNVRTKEALKYDWVFVGSGIHRDEATGETFYYADAGEFICVSNFPTAMLDLPVASSAENNDLLFEAFTERIPPQTTPVRIMLKPRTIPPGTNATKPAAPNPTATPESGTKPAANPKPSESSQPTTNPKPNE